ncbi:flavin reductase [Litchfieldella anticariensis FP35 = DSM 16096]|uniref:Flavin reductase n=1 Tax=Litchfieldella anticariensis (strain DSM 16096 / CECT 5854 / CIP 108499 / LMG 22089 / FP35) TaxID=1121939 RepID=S2KFE9_LITA3|nr:flavin reductase family protein [Halomonas anticariensis]EPC00847.1 flavin reductase [Halomonas anticariensis FP35 = DSM 16096]
MIDTQRYKQVLGAFPTGVTVITALEEDDRLVGFTASAFSAVSMDPPLVLVCPSLSSDSYPVIKRSGRFAVHILGHDQQSIAYRFASKGRDKTEGIAWHRSALGNAILDGATAYLECQLWEDYPGGDHAIVVGEVRRLWVGDDKIDPLLYCRGKMDKLPEAFRLTAATA